MFLKQICYYQYCLPTNLSYAVFFNNIIFTTWINLHKSTGTGSNLSISNLSTAVFKLAKFDFNAKLEVSACEILLISVYFLHN